MTNPCFALDELRAIREVEFARRSKVAVERRDRRLRSLVLSRLLSALRVGQRVSLPGRLRLRSRLGGWQ